MYMHTNVHTYKSNQIKFQQKNLHKTGESLFVKFEIHKGFVELRWLLTDSMSTGAWRHDFLLEAVKLALKVCCRDCLNSVSASFGVCAFVFEGSF